ncbi:hypothetical protein ACOSQ2_032658 [Xanthoceras sorbifolium]
MRDEPMLVKPAAGSCWCAPCLGSFKINIDAAVDIGRGLSGGEVVLMDVAGVVLEAAALVFEGIISAEIAEAKAVLGGLTLAKEKGWFPISVESDSLVVVNLCNGISFSLCEIDNIIFDIKSLLSSMDGVLVSFASRNCNRVAHNIAKWALGSVRSVFWNLHILSWLVSLVFANVSGS